jgi:hypothetical protein
LFARHHHLSRTSPAPQFTPIPDTGQDRSTAFPWPSYCVVRDFAPELQATPETADDDRLRLHHDLAWDYHQLGGYQHSLHHGTAELR